MNQVIRRIVVFTVLGLAALPPAVLIATALAGATGQTRSEICYQPFWDALGRSLGQMACSGAIAFIIGLPYGTALRLLRFPAKGACLLLLSIPLLMPPFLWAIGLQSLKPFFSFGNQAWLDGFRGCVLAYATLLIPLVALASSTAAGQISRSELESAISHGGWRLVFWQALRHGAPAAGGAALLGSILTLSDSGCGQIMGYHGAAGEILVAFSARNDFYLAALKALVITATVLPVLALAVWLLAKGLPFGASGRSLIHPGFQLKPGMIHKWVVGAWMILSGGVLLLPTSYGLVRPLIESPRSEFLLNALVLFKESLPMTLHYGLLAGLLSTGLAVAVVVACGRDMRFAGTVVLVAVALFSLPPSVGALGMLRIAKSAPPGLDFLFRSGWIVGISGGLRLLPLAILLLMASWQRIPASVSEAAGIHIGQGWRFLTRVAVPLMSPSLVAVALLNGLLAVADVTTTILLQPPGGSSYCTHLYAVMDNSAEKVVASLCLVYMLLPLGILSIFSIFAKWSERPERSTISTDNP